jgi:hypothetical protein
MAAICTNSIRKSGAGCDHRTVTVDLDGESIDLHTGERDLDAIAWDDETKRQFVLLGLKRLRVLGLSLDDAIGRVTNGEEATNVKQYPLLMKDVTKTNIGTSYVNVPIGANGERTLVDFTGCTQYRAILHANLVGTGPWQVRIIRDSDSAVLYESPSITQSGERELDTDWQTLPAEASGLMYVRLQAKSSVGADDPIFRRCVMGVR